MEDFTKLDKQGVPTLVNNKVDNLSLNSTAPNKKGFLESRLNKDNFWNLIFWLAISIGFTIALIIKSSFPEHGYGLVFCCATIITAALMLKITCKTNFDIERRFTNSEGISLNNNLPNGWFIVFTVAGIFLTGYVADTFATGDKTILKSFLFFFSFSSGFCIYFILINCPISLLFSSSFWKENNKNSAATTLNQRKSLAPDFLTNPIYRNLPSNIYHKRH